MPPRRCVFARELGVDLLQINGTEKGDRITKADVQKFVKAALSGGVPAAGGAAVAAGGGLNLLPWPKVDFSKFGETEVQPLSRIKKISGANLARNWAMIPHVTQFDQADITDLEALRVALNKENEKAGIKLTMLAFLIKASAAALKKFRNSTPRSMPAAKPDPEEVLPHRLRRRHAERPGRAGDPRRGQEGRGADRAGNRRTGQEGARRQAWPGRHERRLLLDQLAGRHRWHRVHPDRQCTGSGHPRCLQVVHPAGLERRNSRRS